MTLRSVAVSAALSVLPRHAWKKEKPYSALT
jgi:hypothetical protein